MKFEVMFTQGSLTVPGVFSLLEEAAMGSRS